MILPAIIRVLTHEIRNSITPIASLSSDLLKHVDDNNPVQQKEGLEVISNQAKSLTAFLDSYHRLTHLPDPQRMEINMQSLFDKLERLLCAEPDHERVRYIVKDNMLLVADQNLIVLALINLIKTNIGFICPECFHGVSVGVLEYGLLNLLNYFLKR